MCSKNPETSKLERNKPTPPSQVTNEPNFLHARSSILEFLYFVTKLLTTNERRRRELPCEESWTLLPPETLLTKGQRRV